MSEAAARGNSDEFIITGLSADKETPDKWTRNTLAGARGLADNLVQFGRGPALVYVKASYLEHRDNAVPLYIGMGRENHD